MDGQGHKDGRVGKFGWGRDINLTLLNKEETITLNWKQSIISFGDFNIKIMQLISQKYKSNSIARINSCTCSELDNSNQNSPNDHVVSDIYNHLFS
jgi:hypothetical protein